MLRAMGFYHEMQRGDRNKFMKINPKNVQKGEINEIFFESYQGTKNVGN